MHGQPSDAVRAPSTLGALFLSRESVGLALICIVSSCEVLGPFQGAWLVSNPRRRYDAAEVGTLDGIQQGLATVLLPLCGKLVDWTERKRALLAATSLLSVLSVAATVLAPQSFPLQAVMQLPSALSMMLVPLVTNAIALGTMGPDNFTSQVALNRLASHAGVVLSGGAMAALALLGPPGDGAGGSSPLWGLVPVASSVLTVAALPLVRHSRINYTQAAGAEPRQRLPQNRPALESDEECSLPGSLSDASEEVPGCSPQAVRRLFSRRAFPHLLALSFVFNLANMAQLRLVVLRASQLDSLIAIPFTSAAQISAHLGMAVSAVVCGRLADRVGRRPLLLVACSVVCVRALLTAAVDTWYVAAGGTPWMTLIPCQGLDGVGAGLWGVLGVILTRDIAAGTGCFNFAFGCMQTMFYAGGIVSSVVAGQLADACGFGEAYLFLGVVGLLATVQAMLFPETLEKAPGHDAKAAGAGPAVGPQAPKAWTF